MGPSDLFSLHVSRSPASALQFLHERNIAHLDLKPQNILLSSLEKPHLKLAGVSLEQQGKAGPGSPQQSVSGSGSLELDGASRFGGGVCTQQPWFLWSPLSSHQTATGWEIQKWAPSPKGRAFLRPSTPDSSSVMLGSGPGLGRSPELKLKL